MEKPFERPKSFGEILDYTFRLCKNNFSKFFLILLIITGPIYLLEALVLLATGTSFIREVGTGETWLEQIVTGLDEQAETINLGQEIGNLFIGLALIVLGPIAQGSIMFAVAKQKNKEDFTVGEVIKKAFSKFWPILGSSLLFGVILFGLIFVSFIILFTAGFTGGIANPVIGIILALLLFLGLAAGIIFLLTRWGLYLCAVIFENDAPGLTRSWNLTSGYLWRLIGLYAVLFLVIMVVTTAVESIVTIFLGFSVLQAVIVNLISFITTMIFGVAYTIIYFDLRTRKEAKNLNDMIDDYEKN